jgi:hypothetical protein
MPESTTNQKKEPKIVPADEDTKTPTPLILKK